MSLTLTDADRAAIARIRVADAGASARNPDEDIALHFLRAGLERAAKECDDSIFRAEICGAECFEDGAPVYDKTLLKVAIDALRECSATIRALAEE